MRGKRAHHLALLTEEGMDTPQLFSSLSLLLLIHVIPFQLTEGGKSRMVPKSGTGNKDVLWTLLETRTSNGAPANAADFQTSPFHDLPNKIPSPPRNRPKRNTWETPEECHLRTLLVSIKDLGLGYNSEEIILFKYCSGSCTKVRTNHDLTLSTLLQNSDVPVTRDPCCRPTRYENVAFLDNNHQWHEVEKLSASACSCTA